MLRVLRRADVHAPQPLGIRDILVGAERILAIEEDLGALPSELIEVVDLGGRAVIPGLIDSHVHVTGGGGESGPASRVPPLSLSQSTLAGVTTVVGLLGTDDLTRSPADLLAAVRGLEDEGLSAWCWTGGYHLPAATVTGSVRGDLVHIDKIIGVGELALSDHRSSQPSFDELLRIASEVHVAGLMTGKAGMLHLHLGDGPRGLELLARAIAETELPPRTFQPTHVNRRRGLFDEAVDLAGRGVPVDVTAFPVKEGEDAWDAVDAVTRFLDAGGPPELMTVSSDAGGCLPEFDADGRVVAMDVGRSSAMTSALMGLVAAGLRLEEALPFFTSNVAATLRLGRKGKIEVGGDADLVVLDGDRIGDVMARGRWHVRGGKAVVLGKFEKESK